MIEEKRVEDSRVETVHIIRPNHLNAAGRLFGGMLMQWLDEVAGMVAKRHTRANVITASVDNLRFIHGAYKGEMVVIVGKVTSLFQVVHRVPKQWLFFRWGTKAIRQEVVSSNPHTKIVYSEYIELKKRKKK